MKRTASINAIDRVRDPASFPAFPPFPHIPAEQLNAWLEALRIEPVSAMEWDWPLAWTVGPRTVVDSMWFILLSGTAEAWLEHPRNLQTMRAGDMILIPEKVPHLIRAAGNETPRVVAVHFYPTLFGGINLLEMLGFPSYVSDNESLRIVAASERLTLEFALKAPGWKHSMAAEIYQLLLRILRSQPESFQSPRAHHGHPDLRRIFPAVEWIDKNLARSDIDVEQIAATVFLSSAHFRRIFHDVFGMSPIAFVRQRRVDRAAVLMRTTDLSLKEIAFHCGFTDTTYFSKTFRKITKKTPNGYRQETFV